MRNQTKYLVERAMAIALLIIGAQIAIPLPHMIPIRLIITLIYLFMGAIGLPVFASFSGGMDHLLGASGGFLLAFPIQAYITSLLVHKGDTKFMNLIGIIVGTGICYAVGCGYFMYLTKTSLAHSLIICVLPFLAGDALKMLCALTIVRSLKKAFVIRDVLLNE